MSENMNVDGVPKDGAEESLVDKETIARRLGISTRKVDQLRQRKELPWYQIPSRCIRFKLSECEAAVKRFRVPARGETGQDAMRKEDRS